MTITKVIIRKLFDGPKIKGIASIIVDDEFTIHDIKIIEGVERLFCAMPNRHSEDGRYQDIVHPISQEARQKIEEAILEEYYSAIHQEATAS
ncbi:SpoVG family protein [Ethanoligenens harbinense]|uniref:SpoVG family protein n=1 Tax=Ethanoligenens harbinense (strain DSM 18485 / JCM 12961 / CGMCC 1.5033 / YUAN-3) TaxID=663278 RepID=E6U5S4_ETHHY|nr:SpoVG family protein [Ethanoligenens harbinense]ADU27941.1 SpoVG family protein [Ethanoligenens harbinense YUAN-3]AVQ96970.1 septation protein SpoVG [Ethanoligenens harbinense YUAN-3]AYF39630.1 septation protein SpoVG [Ethanoligenens harbinense]AYF42458.1 septation protein SpoVG [Ethanoligenens harbinense]QCN93211.1 septation protein SpoVG [Ethanoligenens harbinense]